MNTQEVVTNGLPNDPQWILDNALRYKRNKEKVTNIKNKVLGQPNLSFIDKIDNAATDLGSAAGLGLTMAGAKLNQFEPTQRMGFLIKRHGINTLLNKNISRRYGYGIPIAGALGTGAILASQTFPEWENDD